MAHTNTFYLQGGRTMKNLKALSKELKSMPDEVYGHHVNDLKNDFANWVRFSLAKEELADKIDGHVHRIEMELEVLRHLVHDTDKKPAAPKKKKAPAKKKAAPKKKAPAKPKPVKKKAAPKKKKVAKKKAPAKKKAIPKKKAAPKKTVKKKAVKKTIAKKKPTSQKKKSKK